jgi:ABC-type glycerol-3-phosphate transport system substrate-binding protein
VHRGSLKKWVTGVLILAALAALYLVPYAILVRQPAPRVTEIYFADRMTDAHRIIIEKYNALNAGRVRVVPVDFPNLEFSTNERKEILARSLRGEGDDIDLLAVDLIWTKRFARWCEPLGMYFSREELARIIPDALIGCYDEGELVAVPLDRVLGVLYYREDLLRKCRGGEEAIRALQSQMTWQAFLGLKERLSWKGPFYVFPASDYEGFICIYVEILLSLRRDYFSAYGFNFDTPEGREALRLLVDLVQKHGATPAIVTSFTEAPSYEYFIRNDGLFLRGWTTYAKDFKDHPYDARKEGELRIAPIPHLSGGRPASLFGGWNLMIPQSCKNKQAVVDFVKFLLTSESQEILYTEGGYFPVVTSFYNDPGSTAKHPEVEAIRELMRTGVHRPTDRSYTNNSKIMSHYFVLAIKKKISVEEAVASATAAIGSDRTMVAAR